MQTFAFICTDPAPIGDELLDIRLLHLLWLSIGVSLTFFAYALINKRIANKKLQISLFVLLALFALSGLALLSYIYTLSTCGT